MGRGSFLGLYGPLKRAVSYCCVVRCKKINNGITAPRCYITFVSSVKNPPLQCAVSSKFFDHLFIWPVHSSDGSVACHSLASSFADGCVVQSRPASASSTASTTRTRRPSVVPGYESSIVAVRARAVVRRPGSAACRGRSRHAGPVYVVPFTIYSFIKHDMSERRP